MHGVEKTKHSADDEMRLQVGSGENQNNIQVKLISSDFRGWESFNFTRGNVRLDVTDVLQETGESSWYKAEDTLRLNT